MKLARLRVRNYRSIEDSGWVDADDLTCLVGRNESGKTAFMEAVRRLNPEYPVAEYTPYEDYPRDEWPEYNRRDADEPDVVASAEVELDDDDHDAIESEYGRDPLDGSTVTVHRDYDNDLRWEVPLDESTVPMFALDAFDLTAEDEATAEALRDADTLTDLSDEEHAALTGALESSPETAIANEIGETVLEDRLPSFRYVGEYSVMNGTIHIDDLIERREQDDLDPGDRVFLALLTAADLDLAEFQNDDDWRERTTELEAASGTITDEAMRYWSQSGNLRIRIRAVEEDDERLLAVRVENRDQDITVEFEQRSHGFRRFFSTFCQLAALRKRDDDVILLLDEPGHSLHARAKREFLSFLRNEIAPSVPVFYTTHSPFMIAPDAAHQTKLVQSDPVEGRNIVTDVALADEDTRFPLRAVFEADLIETLLVRPQTLLVESKADHIYLNLVSAAFRRDGDTGLDDRWTVVPIADPQNIDSFVGLFGGDDLAVAGLLTEAPETKGRGRGTDEEPDRPITLIRDYASAGEGATTEDIFSRSFYLDLVSQAYATELGENDAVPDQITTADLERDGPIAERLQTYFETYDIADSEFDRRRPALYLQRNRGELLAEIDRASKNNFSQLFTNLNNTLESFDGVESQSRSLFDALGI